MCGVFGVDFDVDVALRAGGGNVVLRLRWGWLTGTVLERAMVV